MMDEQIWAKLQSILDNWKTDHPECPVCDAVGEAKYKTITARDGTKFHDLIQLDITHEPDCPYAMIAEILGKSSRQLWQIAPELSGDVDLREKE